MKTNKTATLIIALLSMVTLSCSSTSSMEDKLVGEWQSKGPKPVRLNITKSATDNDGFHSSYSSTEDGKTSTYDWLIQYRDKRPVLYLRGKGYWDDFARRTGNPSGSEYPHRIIDLTTDKFVVEWNTIYFTGSTDIKELQRVTPEVRAAEQRAIEERQAMLAKFPTMLVGTWRDENSLITYGGDGTLSGKYDNGGTTKGTWSVDGDILTDVVVEANGKRLGNPQSQRYQILDLTGEKLASKSLSGGQEWHAARVNQ